MVHLAGRLITKDPEKTCVIESESWVGYLQELPELGRGGDIARGVGVEVQALIIGLQLVGGILTISAFLAFQVSRSQGSVEV